MMIVPPTELEGHWTVSKHGNRMDLKVVAILSLVGVAIWLSHIAAKKRERFTSESIRRLRLTSSL
jgi:hypothetical protein